MALTFIRGIIRICMIVILKKLVEQPDAVVLFDEVDKAGEIKYSSNCANMGRVADPVWG